MVLGEFARDMFLVVIDVEVADIALEEVIDAAVRGIEDEFAEGEDAEEFFIVVGDIEVIDIGEFGGGEGADIFEGLADGESAMEGDEAVIHDTAGGIFGVAEEAFDGFAGFGGEGFEDFCAAVVFEVADDIGGGFCGGESEEVAEVAEGELEGHFVGGFGLHFDEGGGGGIFWEERELVDGLVGGQALEVVRDVGGVEAAEFFGGGWLWFAHAFGVVSRGCSMPG
ncbi:MAG: hypothetical protein RI897_3493 [Verrucomicrobiota bacterium]